MTPNSLSAPSRRSFLGSTAAAAMAVAGGVPLLSACGGSGGTDTEGAIDKKGAAKILPAFTASGVVTPDLPAKNGSADGFTSPIDLAALRTSVPKVLGGGGSLKIMGPFWGSPPKGDCAYYTALNKAVGVKAEWQNQDGNTYGEKLGAVLASSSVPDMVVVPGWELTGKIPTAVASKFMDLGPYLSGDRVKAYPNLAAIPSDAWQRGIFGGKLRGIPMATTYVSGVVPYYRKDIFDAKGYQVPTSAQEFLDLAKEVTDRKKRVYACDDMKWTAFLVFGALGSGSLAWDLVDGKLVHRTEQDAYLEALEWTRKLYAAGVVHPDAKAATGDAGNRFTAGQVLMYNNDMSHWYGKTAEQTASNPEFRIAGMDVFGADGGAPTLYAGTPSGIWSFVRAGAPKSVVKDALAAANYAAAPYGTKERMAVDYGVEGTHYTVRDGVPVKNDLGNQEVVNAWVMLAAPAAYIAHPDHPDVARAQVEWQQRMGAFTKKTPTYGMTVIEPSRYANLSDQFEQLEDDVVRGNKKISDMQEAIGAWRTKGGDKLRDWYKELIDKNGSAS